MGSPKFYDTGSRPFDRLLTLRMPADSYCVILRIMAAVHKGSSKTPQCKRSTKKVLNPLSPGSRTPGTVAFINNDEEERRQRRLDSHTRGVMSPCYSARPQSG